MHEKCTEYWTRQRDGLKWVSQCQCQCEVWKTPSESSRVVKFRYLKTNVLTDQYDSTVVDHFVPRYRFLSVMPAKNCKNARRRRRGHGGVLLTQALRYSGVVPVYMLTSSMS